MTKISAVICLDFNTTTVESNYKKIAGLLFLNRVSTASPIPQFSIITQEEEDVSAETVMWRFQG